MRPLTDAFPEICKIGIRLAILLLILGLAHKAFSQTDHWFLANIYKVNNGYEVPYTVIEEDSLNITLITDNENPRYVSPYTSYLWRVDTVRAIPQYPWTDKFWWLDSFNLKIPIDYPQGVYEITFTHVVYLDSFWVMIDSVNTQMLDSTQYAFCTNASYVGVDTSDTPLPIEMNFFEVVLINGDAVITWITESELSNCGYNIYRKERGGAEVRLNPTMIAGQGSTSVSTTYGLTDPNVLMGHTYIYRLESVSCGGVAETEGRFSIFVPIEYGIFLYQNYPNPANPRTMIQFSIDERAHIKLFLYDTVGRRSKTIRDEMMEAGEYKVRLDASNIASGAYFYVLRAHNVRTNSVRILTKKLTVIK